MTQNRQSPAYALFARHRYPPALQIRHRRHRRQKPDQLPWDVVVTKSNLVRLFRTIVSGRLAVIQPQG